jgi:lipopolysaccharide/colanic/teichoic acid biosynthesis glycosyltransferase
MTYSRERMLQSVRLVEFGDIPMDQRVFDIVLAMVGLIVLTPVMLLVMALIWMESGRPLFFSQIRLGQHGVPFRLYKFRKFRAEEGASGAAVTVRNDPRMTRVGRLLAQAKLDELPQLWNILRGDMSVVGPRPEALAFADCFGDGYRGVLEFRPGVFGPNQVFFRDEGALYPPDRDPEEFYREVLFPLKARADLAYFRRRSLLGDIGWLVRGIMAICHWTPRGASGRGAIERTESWIRQQTTTATPVSRVVRDR